MTIDLSQKRQDIYDIIETLLIANKPTYEDPNEKTKTYTIRSEYTSDNPAFPQLVINKAVIDAQLLNMDGSGEVFPVDVQLDFYTKQKDGKVAIDAGIDSVEATFLDNQASLKTSGLLLMQEPFDETNTAPFNDNNQLLNIASFIVKMKIQ